MYHQVADFSRQRINSPVSFCADAAVRYCVIDAQLTSCENCCSNVCFLRHPGNDLYILKKKKCGA
jgi:hypothetical protein